MKFVELKDDDDRFGHKAGDIFLVDEADYDSDKYTGFKVNFKILDNSFYKDQMRGISLAKISERLIEADESSR